VTRLGDLVPFWLLLESWVPHF